MHRLEATNSTTDTSDENAYIGEIIGFGDENNASLPFTYGTQSRQLKDYREEFGQAREANSLARPENVSNHRSYELRLNQYISTVSGYVFAA